MEEIKRVMETVEGITPEQIRETERRLLEMAEEKPSAAAVEAFARAMAGDEEDRPPKPAVERARLRERRKRERQNRRRGRR